MSRDRYERRHRFTNPLRREANLTPAADAPNITLAQAMGLEPMPDKPNRRRAVPINEQRKRPFSGCEAASPGCYGVLPYERRKHCRRCDKRLCRHCIDHHECRCASCGKLKSWPYCSDSFHVGTPKESNQ